MAAVLTAAKESAHAFPLAALRLFAEKPHPGLHAPSSTFRPGALLAISNTVTGMPVCLYDSGIRSCCSSKERDAESGLDWFLTRYFSGAQGRFTSPDEPLADQHASDPQSWNLYSYVRNNPLRFWDPNGEACVVSGGSEKDDDSGGQTCAQAHEADKNKTPDITVTANQYGSTYAFDYQGTYIPGSFRPPSAKETAIHDDTVNLAMNLSLAGDAVKLGMVLDAGIDLGKIMGILREAAAGKGNFGLGEGTAAEAAAAGKAWVGEGAKVNSDGIMVSQDGLKQYRPPTFKPNEGKVQANFESRPQGTKQWQSNGHLDVK